MKTLSTTCVIAGGGPAGMMTGFLLARAGVDVIVLEKHKDFLRDFRGDTIHPSTLELIAELGVLDKFLARPHTEISDICVEIGKNRYALGDFSRLPTRCKFMALTPQWDFLDFLLAEAERFPNFRLMMQAEVTNLLAKGSRIAGVLVETPEDMVQINAGLVIGADGRHSIVRAKSNLKVREIGAPFDVLWMRLPYRDGDPKQPVARLEGGDFFIMLYRGDYWQCALVIPKGGFEPLKKAGLEAFRERLRGAAGFAADRVDSICDFEDVKLLSVQVDRMRKWARPGLLCIGDAAHAMSPVGGVGVNLAIQDAVATANLLGPVLAKRAPRLSDLKRIQERRQWPTEVVQWLQIQAQKRIVAPALKARRTPRPPLALRLLNAVPSLRRIPARIVGLGVRPEHIAQPPLPASRA